jgi:deoxyhypusine synthase
MASDPPSLAVDALLGKSDPMPENSETVKGYDFSKGVDYHALLKTFKNIGFQATNFGYAVEEINKMVCK